MTATPPRLPRGGSRSSEAEIEAGRTTDGRLASDTARHHIGHVLRQEAALAPVVWFTAAGRTGSILAASLARWPVRELALIDPDLAELHNLGETQRLRRRRLGRNKAEAPRDARLGGGLRPDLVATAVTALAPAPASEG